MRMRKKKYAAQRLDACNNIVLPLSSHEKDYRDAEKNPSYYDIEQIFSNNNPLHLEIGCGKGRFICEIAKRNPTIN